MFLLVIVINGCKEQDEPKIAIGKTYEGGIIFYLDNTGQHGLVAAPKDQGSYIWGFDYTNISGAEGKTIGTGNQNTIDIVASCSDSNIAASVCVNLVLNGYSDWYLPSIDELYLMFQNLHKKGFGDFESEFCFFNCEDVYYWSSTEYDDMFAWSLNFKTGNSNYFTMKNLTNNVRPIRAF
jgi:hypothetical protein